MTMAEREQYDAEQRAIAALGTPPNAAEWEVFCRKQDEELQSYGAVMSEGVNNET